MQFPTISVIVPIYNAEDYLDICIKSIAAQSFEDIEILCVNDGSTDSSLSIIESLASQDQRIRVIDKANEGYGKAINCGLDAARGSWISIIESDDYIAPTMFEEMLALEGATSSEKPDIIKSSYWLYFDVDGQETSYVKTPPLSSNMPAFVSEINLEEDCSVLFDHPSIWSALYRRDFLIEKNIRMREYKGAAWADNPWFFETILQASSMVWTPKPYYYYRQTNPNASSNLNDYHLPFDRLRDLCQIVETLEIDNPHVIASLYRRIMMYIGIVIIDHEFPESDPEIKALISEFLTAADPDLLLESTKEVQSWQADYYRDFTGMFLAEVPQHDAEANPDISIVLLLGKARHLLWGTVRNILKTENVSFEVVCVPYSTKDRSLEIVKSIAERDKRFIVADTVSEDESSACKTGLSMCHGNYVHFIQPGMEYTSPTMLATLIGQLSENKRVDVCLFGRTVINAKMRSIAHDESRKTLLIETSGNEIDLLLRSNINFYATIWKRGFIDANSEAFDFTPAVDFACPFVFLALKSKRWLLVNGCWLNKRIYEREFEARHKPADEILTAYETCISSICSLEHDADRPNFKGITDSCISRLLANGVKQADLYENAREYFDGFAELYKRHLEEYEPSQSNNNYREYLWLTQVFEDGFDRFVLTELRHHRIGQSEKAVQINRTKDELQATKRNLSRTKKALANAKKPKKKLPARIWAKGKRGINRLLGRRRK